MKENDHFVLKSRLVGFSTIGIVFLLLELFNFLILPDQFIGELGQIIARFAVSCLIGFLVQILYMGLIY